MVVLCSKTNSDDGMGYLETVVGGATALSTHPKSSNTITNVLRASTNELLSMPDLTSLIESNTTANDIFGSIVCLTHPNLNPHVRYLSCSKVLISEATYCEWYICSFHCNVRILSYHVLYLMWKVRDTAKLRIGKITNANVGRTRWSLMVQYQKNTGKQSSIN